MKKTITVFFQLFFLSIFVQSQIVSGNLENYLNEYISNLPADNGYQYRSPSVSELNTWQNVVFELLNSNINYAKTYADSLNYTITIFNDTSISSGSYYILEEKSPQTNYWGIYVFTIDPCRDKLVLQAPHPLNDYNTGKEAIYCFLRLSAKALFISGTHRCNNDTASLCDGTTTACSGSLEPFIISDMAHNASTVFQKTTAVLYEKVENSQFIQLHGFTKQTSDPYLILSNGTQDTPDIDYALQISNALLEIDPGLSAKIAHLDLDWDRLVAFTNTQGRLINESPDPCDISVSSSTGRFIHIEQEKSKLRQDSSGWNKMHTALASIFPCNITSVSNNSNQNNLIIAYPNPSHNEALHVNSDNLIIMHYMLNDISGKLIVKVHPQKNEFIIDSRNLEKGIYFLTLQMSTHKEVKKLILL